MNSYQIITNCSCPGAQAVSHEDHGTMGAKDIAIQYARDRASAGGCTASATVYGDAGDKMLAKVCVDQNGKIKAAGHGRTTETP